MRSIFSNRKGSAQVVEMSFVLPAAMLVVIALMYLAFGMFMYVHSFNLAGIATDELAGSIGKEGMYWQIRTEYISETDKAEIVEKLRSDLKAICIFHGLDFSPKLDITTKLGQPYTVVSVDCNFLGEKMYTVRCERMIYTPEEFADSTDALYKVIGQVDFSKITGEKYEKLKEMYHEFF